MEKQLILNGDYYDSNCMLPHSSIYEDSDGTKEFALNTIHFADGILFINGMINTDMSLKFVSCMLKLSKERRKTQIFIDSDGGEVNAGMVMYDTIQSFKYEIEMFCIGRASSMAAVLLAGGQKGRRYILPHSKVIIHEPLIASGISGSASSIEKTAQRILEVRNITNGILAKHTGHTLEEINKATEFENEMTAEQAVEFGICDEIRYLF
ncbi:ClpP family protease [Ruminococcus sp.]|uniref:ClpP family protease n=1 Tax=Ruminococcus sp. TaxID=41978 RepID=UPI0025FA3116|nr:ATP-dependent Clp protease proteolytic subunit [Ruminococcus sp.]